jgi:4-amino-4-deoxy-L-arabinose transferase-like glycosyltransferase
MLDKIIKNHWLVRLLIATCAALLFIPFIGNLHLFDWDEINFAESAREMIVTHNYLNVQIDFKPFWEKPPLFIWFQLLSMKLFGINEFAARFPNAICGIITLLCLYEHGKKLFDSRFGLIWVLMYACSILPFLYFKSGIIDPWFNLFIFNGIAFFAYYIQALSEPTEKSSQIKNLLLSACFIGLAVLTKGPVAFLVFSISLAVFLLVIKFKMKIKPLHVLLYLIAFSFVGGLWFIIQWLSGNGSVIMDFINYQIRLFTTKDAGHGGFLLYHFVVLLLGVFPASVFALPFIWKILPANTLQVLFQRWMVILFWTVLILFTIVKTKIVHYSSLCYFPITYLAALYAYSIENQTYLPGNWVRRLQLIIGGLIAFVAIALPFLAMNISWIANSGWIDDAFAVGNMKAAVHWSGLEASAGFVLLAGLVFYGRYAFRKAKIAYRMLLYSSLICVTLLTLLVTPRIEGYSQRAAIEFYEEVAQKNERAYALDFFSYAPLFYANRQPSDNPKVYDLQWLLTGDIDKDTYFVVKVDRLSPNLEKYPTLQVLYEKNGFVFLKRKAIKNDQ